jgi:WD40 repeat protein
VFSPDGQTIITAEAGVVAFWRLGEEEPYHTFGDAVEEETRHALYEYNRLAVAPDGSVVASALEDGTLRVWRVADGTLLYSLTMKSPAEQLMFTADSSTLLASNYTYNVNSAVLQQWRVSDGTLMATIAHQAQHVRELAFTADSAVLTYLAVGDYAGTVRLWRVS